MPYYVLYIMFISKTDTFFHQGEKIPHKPLTHQSRPSSYSWHPTRKILAVGWETGEITLWNEQDKELIEAPHTHKSEISVMKWSSQGSRLLTADTVGCKINWFILTVGFSFHYRKYIVEKYDIYICQIINMILHVFMAIFYLHFIYFLLLTLPT